MAANFRFTSRLVPEEIQRIVDGAVNDRSVLSASQAAVAILKVYPNCGIDEEQLADRVMMAAASAGVVVEIGPRGSAAVS